MADDNKLVKAQIRATDAEIKAFVTRLDGFLAKHLRKILKGLEAGDVSDTEAASLLGSLESELISAGLEKEISKLRATYASELKSIKEAFADEGAKKAALTDADRTTVETLITFDTDKIAGKLSQYTDDLKGSFMRSVMVGEPIDVSEAYDALSPRIQSQLEAETNTLISTFSRTVTATKAQDLGFELMVYVGPDDKITREFCGDCLQGKLEGLERDVPIYTIEEINSMDNGTAIPVLQGGGGYNCRHRWRPISEERARERGWKPSEESDGSEGRTEGE